MTAWWRWGLFVGFHLSFKVFAMRGFWVVLFYILFDVVAVSLAFKTGTAHWAHIGGFIFGITAGLILLVGRVAYSRTDILSLILGKYAWPLIGTPYGRG
jgi:membrane associated rhomboid family serine protease